MHYPLVVTPALFSLFMVRLGAGSTWLMLMVKIMICFNPGKVSSDWGFLINI